jgi:hypothetical protein
MQYFPLCFEGYKVERKAWETRKILAPEARGMLTQVPNMSNEI